MPKLYLCLVLLLNLSGYLYSLPLWNALQAPAACGDPSKISATHFIQMATDSQGNIWLFGGEDTCEYPNQLRYFDITENTWVIEWDASSSENPGPSIVISDNALWIDKNDNIWIYGGQDTENYNFVCSFWMYNVATKSWTDLTPADISWNYGQQGSPSVATYPGCYHGMAAWYTSDDNSLWMAFGLQKPTTTLMLAASMMWQYQIDLGQWMWHSGPTSSSPNSVILSDDFSFDNYPGGRWGPFFATDDDNNFWLLGGTTNKLMYNDLWVFSRTQGWKYLGGVKTTTELADETPPVNGQFSADVWPGRSAFNSLVYAGNGMLAMLRGFMSDNLNNNWGTDEDWYYDIATNQWARTYNNSDTSDEPKAVTTVMNQPDESTRPGNLYYSRTVSRRGKIWAIGSSSAAVLVKDLDNGAFICELNPVCHADATCVTGTGCVCNEGFEGTGRGLNGCTSVPAAPVAPVASPASPSAQQPGSPVAGPGTNAPRTSIATSLLIGPALMMASLLIA